MNLVAPKQEQPKNDGRMLLDEFWNNWEINLVNNANKQDTKNLRVTLNLGYALFGGELFWLIIDKVLRVQSSKFKL